MLPPTPCAAPSAQPSSPPAHYCLIFRVHILQGAASYALYNAIDVGTPVGLASHPLRQLLDPYMDPDYPLEFMSGFFGGLLPPPPTPIQTSSLPAFIELYAAAGPFGAATLHSCHPRQVRKGEQAPLLSRPSRKGHGFL